MTLISESQKEVITAIPSYRFNVIRILVSAGWDINDVEDGGLHLLLKACEKDDIYRLNFLLECGLAVVAGSQFEKEAMAVAKEHGGILVPDRIRNFVKLPSIKRTDGSTPLHESCIENDLDFVKSLVESGALVNERNKLGVRPLHLACLFRS